MDYPDPEEEFELMYAEEMEVMNGFGDPPDDRPSKKSKKSLDFSKAASNKTTNGTGSNKALDDTSYDVDLMELDDLISQPTVPPSPKKTDHTKTAAAYNVDLSELEDLMSQPVALRQDEVSAPRTSPPVAEKPPGASSLERLQEALNTSDMRKRKSDQLFGDIGDIGSDEEYFDMMEPGAKRKNLALDDDYLIQQIRTEREKNSEQINLRPNASRQNSNSNENEFISVRVPKYPFITMRNFDSKKFYLRLRSDDYVEKEASKITAKSSGLLPGSYKTVWEEANVLLAQKKEMTALVKKLDALGGGEFVGVPAGDRDASSLWVDKYQPRSYKDLLSDEGTNKTLLKWLKLWDPIVFNIKRKAKPVQAQTPQNDRFKGKSKFPPKNQQKILNEEFDAHGRPMQKIALLCGPPGLGKTTLAHIVAKHAGYNPVEVNASDDSNPEAFRLQLEAATQMKSVMGNDPRPNCLILDEIDGSLSTAIDVLLQFISDKSVGKGKKQKGGKPKILKRPIICICNDMYATALRPLRQVALIIHFPPTASGRLAQRLMDIAKLENLKTDFGALLLLCDKTNNDIRSCLSFLHFFKSRGREVRLMDVQLASVGQKDTHKGLFSVWQEIFQIIRHKHIGGSAAGKPDGGILSLTSRMGRILRTVQSYGDYDRLSQGVFENYLHMKMRDTRFQSVAVGTEWFCYYDHINTSLKESQTYVLMPYMPYCFAMWHFLYSSANYPRIRYPNSGYELSVKTNHNQMTLNSVHKGMDPHIRSGSKAVEILLDVLPMMMYIIMPCLKNANAQLFTVHEKIELNRVVNIFIEFGLVYVQERTVDGDMIFRMEPNVQELVQFPDVPHATTATYAVKQVVAHAVEAEKIRRLSGIWGEVQPGQAVVANPSLARASPKQQTAKQNLPNHLQSLSPQILKPQKLKPGLKNWLSITKKPSLVAKEQAAADKCENLLNEISYCYKEGYSNAVRKNVRIADLL